MQSLLETKATLISTSPFCGMEGLLEMLSQLPKASDSITKQQVFSYLKNAWAECTTKEKREAFYAVFFSIGDIQNREHNIFSKRNMGKVEGGGHSKRKVFMYQLEWLLTHQPSHFYKFMPILGEYYSLDVFSMYHLVTDRHTGIIHEVIKLPFDVEVVTGYITSILKNPKTTDQEKCLWARWLPHIPASKRIRKYTMTEKNIEAFLKNGHKVKLGDVVTVKRDKQNVTNSKDAWTTRFIQTLSRRMGWQVIKYDMNLQFRGYKTFRSKYQEGCEATMFSTQKIKELDESQLLEWFNTLSNGARYRVANRLVFKNEEGKYISKGKWVNKFGVDIATIYTKWLDSREARPKVLGRTNAEGLDPYAKLETIHNSNRYAPVRDLVA